ncbi:ABC transporter substrate-binding protein [Cumulibacter soli]|uniref:ABC transporter substrate-binding protein n=1 Tax=Cumulibacter soli TaxID=2546344 RepID=UPI001067429D|nr:ABC transporter substrate-binding protein [Cumulibacter soli]
MRIVRHLTAAAVALALPLAIAGCGSSEDDAASGDIVGAVDRGPTTDVRASDGGLKVVALGWSDGEIALDLGIEPIAIYDWQGHGEDNNGVGPWAADKFTGDAPEVIENTGTTYNYEQIELLEPDVILNVRASADPEVFDRLTEIAPVAAAPEGTADFAVDWATQTEIIGKAIGKESEATASIEETNASIEAVAEANPDFADKTFAYGAKFGDAYGAYLAGDARFDVFASMGFVPNPEVEALESQGFFASVPIEQAPALDADVAILTTIGVPFDELENDPVISSLDVVSSGRAILLEETSEINTALAAGTPESITLAVEGAEPLLVEAVAQLD